jgi:hypothetical protein
MERCRVPDRICESIRAAKQILKELRSLAEEALITFAVIYGLYCVCRILIG